MMNLKFAILSDLDFYCFLKAHLPAQYTIVSEPQKSYYSEWDFCYKIFKNDVLVEEYNGNFKSIAKGFLVQEAMEILKKIESKNDHR
jgi:hypothetical protein